MNQAATKKAKTSKTVKWGKAAKPGAREAVATSIIVAKATGAPIRSRKVAKPTFVRTYGQVD